MTPFPERSLKNRGQGKVPRLSPTDNLIRLSTLPRSSTHFDLYNLLTIRVA